jgi:hypothetical protein
MELENGRNKDFGYFLIFEAPPGFHIAREVLLMLAKSEMVLRCDRGQKIMVRSSNS